jgi:hypothetical protein
MMRKYQVRFGGEALEKFQQWKLAVVLPYGSSSSREALTSNPFTTGRGAIRVLEGVIRGFYPIGLRGCGVRSEDGRRRNPSPSCLRNAGGLKEAVMAGK